jgi:hypothetical protein
MKSRLSMLAALGLACAFGSVSYVGCSSSSSSGPQTTPDTGVSQDPECTNIGTPTPLTNAGCDQSTASDRCNPPGKCGPTDYSDAVCHNTSTVDGCPSDTACMATAKQSGNVLNYRMGRIHLYAPASLLSLESIAVTPFVSSSCVDHTNGEGFSWLIQVDKSTNTIVTGGARKSADHVNFSFLQGETVNPSDLGLLCPGFGTNGGSPITLAPVTGKVHWNGNTFSTDLVPKINIPIFDSTVVTNPPVILPLQEAYMKNVTISSDSNCIGSWQKDYFCGDSKGWTTDGVLIGKITADDADQVPVKTAGCQSLCKLLVNDASKSDGNFCKKGPDGKHVLAGIGDACVGGVGCNNAFLLSATFGAYGVNITAVSTTGDAGTETGTDAGTSDAADGG